MEVRRKRGSDGRTINGGAVYRSVPPVGLLFGEACLQSAGGRRFGGAMFLLLAVHRVSVCFCADCTRRQAGRAHRGSRSQQHSVLVWLALRERQREAGQSTL